jgi:hypothetical protein
MSFAYSSVMENPAPPYPVQSVDHVLQLLLMLKRDGLLRVSDGAWLSSSPTAATAATSGPCDRGDRSRSTSGIAGRAVSGCSCRVTSRQT